MAPPARRSTPKTEGKAVSTAPGGSDAAATPTPSPALLRALRRLLAPLVRLLLDHQITFPVVAGLLKSVYVEEADRGLALPGRPQTISRLSLLTGIHRKDVKRLREEAAAGGDDGVGKPAGLPLAAQLVARWTADPAFLDDAGRPRPLPRLARDDAADGESFESLVAAVTQDIRPRAVLDEWVRLGVAEVDGSDLVHLREEAFVPSDGFDEKAYFFGRNVRDHIATARHNLTGEGEPRFERSVYYARLRTESVQELQALAREAGADALRRVNQRADALQRADEGEPDARHRMSFGAFFHRERLEDDAANPSEDEDDER